jgi:hypothetical protein
LSFIELTLTLNDNLMSRHGIRMFASLIVKPKIKQLGLIINSGFIAAQSAFGGHFVFFIINFQGFFLNYCQQQRMTQIFYFDCKVRGLLVSALSAK